MKPVAFEYQRPATVGEACRLLAADGNARVLAGGQTLIPMLAMRLARPSCLVDIARIPSFPAFAMRDFRAIGAATGRWLPSATRSSRARSPAAKALPGSGMPRPATAPTIGGSIANGDPAAEIPLVAVTLNATLVIQTAAEQRADCRGVLSRTDDHRAARGGISHRAVSGMGRGRTVPASTSVGTQERFARRCGGAGRAGCGRPLHGARGRVGRSRDTVRLDSVAEALIDRIWRKKPSARPSRSHADFETADDFTPLASIGGALRQRSPARHCRRAGRGGWRAACALNSASNGSTTP